MAVVMLPVPPINQRQDKTVDGRPAENAPYDCVEASSASVLGFDGAGYVSPDHLKDLAYGEAWRNAGTSEDKLIGIMADYGTKVTPYPQTPRYLLQEIVRQVLVNGRPSIVSIPSYWNTQPERSKAAGRPYIQGPTPNYPTHAVVFRGVDSDHNTASCMNPWDGTYQTYSYDWWTSRLSWNKVYLTERIAKYRPVTGLTGWEDDGFTLLAAAAPDGKRYPVVRGFRKYILRLAALGKWNPRNVPVEAERQNLTTLEMSNPSLGGGSQQVFLLGMLEWTPSNDWGVFEAYIGVEFLALKAKAAA